VRQALSLDAAAVYHVDYLFVRYRARLLKQPGGLDVDSYLRTKMPVLEQRWNAHVSAYDVLRNMTVEVTANVLRLQEPNQLPEGVGAGQAVICRLCIERLLYVYPAVDADAQALKWSMVSFDGRT